MTVTTKTCDGLVTIGLSNFGGMRTDYYPKMSEYKYSEWKEVRSAQTCCEHRPVYSTTATVNSSQWVVIGRGY